MCKKNLFLLLFIVIIHFLMGTISNQSFAQEHRISPGLLEKMAQAGSDEFIPVTIVMREQVPLAELKALASGKSKQERRNVVIARLKEVAFESQGELRRFLDVKKNMGDVKNIKPFWLANIISVDAEKSVIMEISQRQQVKQLRLIAVGKAICDNDIAWQVTKVHAPNV